MCELEKFNKTKTSFIVHWVCKFGINLNEDDERLSPFVLEWKRWRTITICTWMKTMKDYQHLQLKCYVLLLADVFEKFRNRCS